MPLGRIDEETTANIGRFEGGTQTNIVCDQVDILAEARSLVPEKMEKQTEKMKQAFEAAAAEMGGRARWKSKSCTRALNTKTGISSLKSPKAAGKIGRPYELLTSGGGSDANVIAGHGIPTVNLAVGYEQIHTKNEKNAD